MSEPTATMTVHIPQDVKARLEELSRTTSRPESWLAADAISAYVDMQEWQIAEIQKGIEEADAGEFASDEEVKEVFAKWTHAR
jgi:predicted transcriptional regulator